MKTKIYLVSYIFYLLGLNSFTTTAQCLFEETSNGVIAIEAENFESQQKTSKREWFVIGNGAATPKPDPDESHADSASGKSYIEILPDTRVSHNDRLIVGENFSDKAGEMAVLNYKVNFKSAGKYFVWVRLYSSGPEDNSIHVGLDNTWPKSGERMQWCQGKRNWTWESKQRTREEHCGIERQIYLDVPTPGEHTFQISMREDGVEVDKIVLSKNYTKPNGEGPTAISTNCNAADNQLTENVTVSGTLQRWHKVTLTCEGPNTNETANPNPFMNYRFDATFTHESGKKYVVPGYYSACGNPSAGCSTGNKWKVHFAPDRPGNWSYALSFKTGNKVAIATGGSSAGFFDDKRGTFTIAESNKSGRDFRNKEKGKLRYTGDRYLRFAGVGADRATGNYFIKAGSDAPENTLAYNDFDATPNRGQRRKNWQPHQRDYNAADAQSHTWQNGKGTELLGVVNYLATKKLNAMSFLTFSLHGDDENVFPHLMKVSENQYNNFDAKRQWEEGVYKTRFDVSKLAQWEKIFEYADKRGVFLHFKTLETENDNIMDNDDDKSDEIFGDERKIYYRELVARFSHHLAMNWNISEESTLKDETLRQTASYIRDLDPYKNHLVLHTFPWQKQLRYEPLLGNKSELTGASLQTADRNYKELKDEVLEWINKSAQAEKQWVICVDEPGNAQTGIDDDDNGSDDKLVRDKVLWTTLLAGGMGVEYYYGYRTEQTDLNAQSHRTRDQKYTEAAHAINFFEKYLLDKIIDMKSMDTLTEDDNDHVFANEGDIYVVYRPSGGQTKIDLPGNNWKVQWYNPRTGGNLSELKNISNDNLIAPGNNDWVAIVTKNGISTTISPIINSAPIASFILPAVTTIEDGYTQLIVEVDASDPDGDKISATLRVDGQVIRTENVAPYEWGHQGSPNPNELLNLEIGDHILRATITDDKGEETVIEKKITVIGENQAPTVSLTSPVDGAIFNLGDTINLSATASDPEGNLEKVNFKVNGVFYKSDNERPFANTFTTEVPGTYKIAARAFDKDGLSFETEITITIGTTLSSENFTKTNQLAKVKLYPSPASSILNISGLTNNENTVIEIIDVTGKILISEKLATDKTSIDVSKLATSIYFLKLQSKSAKKVLRFVKE